MEGGGREEVMEGWMEGGRDGGRDEGTKGRMDGGREGGKDGENGVYTISYNRHSHQRSANPSSRAKFGPRRIFE